MRTCLKQPHENIGNMRSYCLISVATETCGQLRPLKFSSTLWEYCNCVLFLPCGSSTVSTQKIASISTDCALGPPAAPCRKAILELPPPVAGGLSGTVEIFRVEVEMMCSPAIAAA